MRALRTVRAAALVLLLVLWAACTVLHVKQLVRGQLAWVGVYVTSPATADDVPSVRGFWPSAPAHASGGLQLGDRLLRAGTFELRGVGPIGFVARAYAAATALHVPITYERDGATGTTSIELVPVAYPWRLLPLTAAMVLTAAWVMMRRRWVRIARSFFLLAVAYGLHWTFFFGGPVWQTWAWVVVFATASSVMLPLVLRALLLFPSEIAPAGGRLPWWPWLFAVFGPISTSWIFGVPLAPETGFRAVFAVNVAFIVAMLLVATRNFRRAGPRGRRQLKWIVLGLWIGTLPVLLADAVGAAVPTLWWLHDPAAIAEIAIPVSIVIAIRSANLFDVDRLITGTAVYSLLSVLLLAALLFVVPQVAGAVSKLAGFDPHVVQPVLSVVVAAGLVPGHRVLQPRIERVVFRERHALRSGVDTLLWELAEATNAEELLTLVGDRLVALVRPRSCVIHVPLGSSFAPVFAHGVDAPAPLDVEHSVVAAAKTRTAPFTDRELLGDATLVPVGRGGELAAVIVLGAKRSGDVYTSTDLALLATVAEKASAELLRYDSAEILRQERQMSEALRRYVPEPVAVRLTRGQSIEGGEEDVSVLFVDIRGYTTFSEQRAAGAVFSMVNRYTEAVSAVIQRRGGTVVEFLGDGLMAVFGAPEPMPDHARLAVKAAREVVATVRQLALGTRDGAAPISVGVGIASGKAFVGNVRTNDRLVYTAVGDVVNLASRIERLTRELQAAVAIDEHTHRRAGDSTASFERHACVRIRGRAEPVDVYALPLAAA